MTPYNYSIPNKVEEKTMELKTQPFVKWAGGKRQLLAKLEARMPESYGKYYDLYRRRCTAS